MFIIKTVFLELWFYKFTFQEVSEVKHSFWHTVIISCCHYETEGTSRTDKHEGPRVSAWHSFLSTLWQRISLNTCAHSPSYSLTVLTSLLSSITHHSSIAYWTSPNWIWQVPYYSITPPTMNTHHVPSLMFSISVNDITHCSDLHLSDFSLTLLSAMSNLFASLRFLKALIPIHFLNRLLLILTTKVPQTLLQSLTWITK